MQSFTMSLLMTQRPILLFEKALTAGRATVDQVAANLDHSVSMPAC